jgi:hypothetical protein
MAIKMARKRNRKTAHKDKAARKLPQATILEAAKTLLSGLGSAEDEWDDSDPESVEEKISEAISSVLKDNSIRLEEEDRAGLSSIIGVLFGIDSDLRFEAERFEDLINGYFGEVESDDMEEARSVLDDILSGLREYIKENEIRPPLFDRPNAQD